VFGEGQGKKEEEGTDELRGLRHLREATKTKGG